MMGKTGQFLFVAAAALIGAGNAQAAITFTPAAIGSTQAVHYVGRVSGATETGIGADQLFKLVSIGNGGKTYNFSYSLTNSSSLSARLRSFGFDVLSRAGLSTASALGGYSVGGYGQNFPEGVGFLDVCFKPTGANGNCVGGNGGLLNHASATGTFSLNFATAVSSVTFDNLAVRFQSITGAASSSGVGVPGAVPEPASWVLMIGGFGMAGGFMRRRRIATTYAAG